MEKSPLYTVQKEMGATTGPYFGWEVPLFYTDPQEEYRKARESLALTDRSLVGRLKLGGKDALDLLNRLSTNQLITLEVGSGAATVLTNNKGRILDLLTVFRLQDWLLVLTSPQTRGKVMNWIERYTFLEEVSTQDITPETALLGLLGPGTPAFLHEVTGMDVTSLRLYQARPCQIAGVPVLLLRSHSLGGLACDIMVEASRAPYLWGRILEGGAAYGIAPLGVEAWEVLRIEAGMPSYGMDLGEEYNPLEAGLREVVSFHIPGEVVAVP